jgi:hypothetical protein
MQAVDDHAAEGAIARGFAENFVELVQGEGFEVGG